jgi:hypothetical protein
VPHFYKLYPSRICSTLLFSVYSLTLLTIFTLPIVGSVKAALTVILVCSLVYYLRRDAWLLSSSSYVAIRIEGNNITLITRGDIKLTGKVLCDSVVTSVVSILKVLPQGKKSACFVVIFPDSLDTELSRELRVLLKWAVDVNRP